MGLRRVREGKRVGRGDGGGARGRVSRRDGIVRGCRRRRGSARRVVDCRSGKIGHSRSEGACRGVSFGKVILHADFLSSTQLLGCSQPLAIFLRLAFSRVVAVAAEWDVPRGYATRQLLFRGVGSRKTLESIALDLHKLGIFFWWIGLRHILCENRGLSVGLRTEETKEASGRLERSQAT